MFERIFFVCPSVRSRGDMVRHQHGALAKAAEAAGAAPMFLVDKRFAPDEAETPERFFRCLDLPEEYARRRYLVTPELVNAEYYDPLADRLAYAAETLEWSDQDLVIFPDGDLAQLDAIWSLGLRLSAARTPAMHLHMSEIAPCDVALTESPSTRVMDRLRLATARLDALELLDDGKLSISSHREKLRLALESAGLPCARVRRLAWRTTGGAGRSIAVLSRVATPAVLELAERAAGRERVMLFVDEQAEEEAHALIEKNQTLQAVVRITPEFARTAEDFAAVIAVGDLAELLLCAPGAVAIDREIAVGGASELVAADYFRLEDAPDGLPHAPEPPERSLMEHALGVSRPAPAEQERKWVVHIAPGWGGAGSSHVFEAQLQYLRSRGYAVLAVHLDTDDAANWAEERGDKHLSRLPNGGALHRWLVSRNGRVKDAEEASEILSAYEPGFMSVEGEGRMAHQAEIPSTLRDALASREIAFVVLNYAHNWPVIRRLGLEGTQVLVETHDVRARQHVTYNKKPLDVFDAELEARLTARANGAVFINENEERAFTARRPMPSMSTFPFMQRGAVETATAPFATPATNIVKCAGQSRGLTEEMIRALIAPDAPRDFRIVSFVGTDHEANVRSLRWFLEGVFLPTFAYSNVRLVVAGNIERAFPGTPPPNTVFLGRVDLLQPLYVASDVASLAVIEGTGLPIKVIDVIMSRTPFVATSKAIDAIAELQDVFPVFDDPAAHAAELRRLLEDPDARKAQMDRIDMFRRGEGAWTRYTAAWDGFVERVTNVPPPLQVDDHPSVLFPPSRSLKHPASVSDSVALSRSCGIEYMDQVWDDENGEQYHFAGGVVRMGLSFAGGAEDRDWHLTFRIDSDCSIPCRLLICVDGAPAGMLPLKGAMDAPVVIALNREDGAIVHQAVVEMVVIGPDGAAMNPRDTEMWIAMRSPRLERVQSFTPFWPKPGRHLARIPQPGGGLGGDGGSGGRDRSDLPVPRAPWPGRGASPHEEHAELEPEPRL